MIRFLSANQPRKPSCAIIGWKNICLEYQSEVNEAGNLSFNDDMARVQVLWYFGTFLEDRC